MASGHEISCNDDTDLIYFRSVGSSCILNDPSSQPEENSLVDLGSFLGFQPLFHQYHEDEPTMSQDLPSSHQPLGNETNLPRLYRPQPEWISNIPEGSHALYQQPSENVSSVVHETQLFSDPRHEIRFSGNENAGPLNSSGMEFRASPTNHSFRQNLCVHQPRENDGSHLPIIQSYGSVPSANQPVILETYSLSENRTFHNEFSQLHPQELQQSGRNPNTINTISSGHPASGLHFMEFGEIYPPTRKIPNQLIANQDLHSQIRQPVETDASEIQEMHSFSQAFTQNRCTRQLPHSYSPQHFVMGPFGISHAENQSSTSGVPYPLSGYSRGTSSVINKIQNIPDQVPVSDIRIECQHPYSNRSELINILVYGPADWTSRFLQTYAKGIALKFVPPYSFVLQRNITRCGILVTIMVWQIDDLIKSSQFLRSSCLTSKSTIMFMLKVKDRLELFLTLHPLIELIRRDISWNVPVVLVGSKVSEAVPDDTLDTVSRNNLAFTNTGFRLKAKYDLSAFLECSVDSTEEINATMLTAIDVSLPK